MEEREAGHKPSAAFYTHAGMWVWCVGRDVGICLEVQQTHT